MVTARKRSESLQDVPLAVSAFTGDQLQTFQVDEITEVARMSPNVTMNETSGLVGGAITVFMRGIGNDPGLDQGVGIYVDDVYLNRTSGALLDVFDVERIELLKGPQGHLYGRNTIGGAIKYITREPGEELEGNTEVKIGSDGYVRVKGAVAGPLIPSALYGGLSFAWKERDGYQTNRFDGSDPWDADAQAIRGSLIWTPAENLKVKLAADYSKDDSRPPIPNRVALDMRSIGGITFVTTGANQFFGAGTGIFDSPNDVRMPTDEDAVASGFGDYDQYGIEQANVALTVEWDINDQWVLKSVTAGRFLESTQPFDFDGSEQQWINTLRSNLESDDISQEFQLNFTGDSISAVMGLYYLDGDQTTDGNDTLQTARLRAVQTHFKNTYLDDREVESISVYGNLDWDFAEDWQLSVGGRYTEDSKTEIQLATVDQTFFALATFDRDALVTHFTGLGLPVAMAEARADSLTAPGSIVAIMPGQEAMVESHALFGGWLDPDGPGPRPPLSRAIEFSMPEDTDADDEWGEFTPSVRLSHHLGDDTLVYAGYSTGFKSGGFERSGGRSDAYEPETVSSYSLGLKTTLLDGAMRLNAEVFYNDYQDKQLASIQLLPSGDLEQTTTNVGEVTSSGFEFEASWLPPVDGLMLSFNVGYLDSEVDAFPSFDEDTEDPIELADTTELGYSPEWTGQFRASYEVPIGTLGTLTLGSDISYQDEMFTTSPIDTTDSIKLAQRSDSHYIWNAMAAFRTRDDRWRIAIEGKNLGDERALVHTFDIGIIATGGYTPPRTWAVSVGYTF